jgi:3-hydroxy-9,10-secoandrosta-1,3,5(10)-triene-9,17-dione monooxygenase reductase component
MTAHPDLTPVASIEPRAFRETLGHYPSGITIIAGHDGSRPIGFTCQSFYSVSMAPPLISFSVMRTSTSYPPIRATGRFSVNVLAGDQTAISDQFARSGTDKWNAVGWEPSAAGNPLIRGSLMWLDCAIHAEHEAGDHVIVVGEVLDTSDHAAEDEVPLLFYRGRYRHLGEHVV